MAPLDLSMPRSRLPLLLLLLLAVRPSEEQLVSVQTETVAVGSASTSSSSPIEYLLEIQVQTSDLVEVRNLQNTLKLPTALSNTSDITGLNITTVCALVADSFQCECESTFFWPLDSCQRYGSCGQPEATCTCLTSLPANGLFCQPRFEWLYEVELGIPGSLAMAAASLAVARPMIRGISVSGSQLSPVLFLTEVNLTTVCTSPTDSSMKCQCEGEYGWSCEQCETYGVCTSKNTTDPCGCINGFPADGQLCQPIISLSSCPAPLTPTPARVVNTLPRSLTMAIDFQEDYTNPEDDFYKTVEGSIKSNSVKAGFTSYTLDDVRPGSVIVDYTVSSTLTTPPDATRILEEGLFSDLGAKFRIVTNPPLRFEPADVFTGDPFRVFCIRGEGTDGLGDVSWELNGMALTATNNPLTVSPLFSQSTSFYNCTYAEGSQVTGVLTVKPRPQLNLKPLSRTVGCVDGLVSVVELECCVQSPYEVQLNAATLTAQVILQPGDIQCKRYNYSRTCVNGVVPLTCQEATYTRFKRDLTLTFSTDVFLCEDEDYGGGQLGDEATTACRPDEVGFITAECQEDGTWVPLQDNCVLIVFNNLLLEAENLDASTFTEFVGDLSIATVNNTDRVSDSPANIHTIVSIFTRLANVSRSLTINESLMTGILDTANVLVDDRSRVAWNTLNTNYNGTNNLSSAPELIQTMSDSSAFLRSIEEISNSLSDDPDLNVFTERITLNRSRFSGSFSANLSMVLLELPGPHRDNSFITTINFNSLDNVLLPSNASGANTSNVINGNVLLVLSNSSVDNVTFTFDILNQSLTSPQCVFWNFSLLDNDGAWDGTGCTAGVSDTQIVTCNCNHLTSFSILMSPSSPRSEILDYITYIGVGISLLSLVICLIIEAIIWRKINRNSTSYLRHTCIVNIAVSLLIANIWFIVGAFVSDSGSVNPPACFAVTFFIHFFYLSLFFWMLMSGLLLLYRTISVFGGGLSDGGMVAVGFSVGYGAPLLIAVVTIAVTAPDNVFFRRSGVCWLNWYESMALLAFVIPALLIVVINLVILAVVLYKMLRSQSMGNSDRSTLMVIVRSLAVLTPFFGTTWGLGVGTMTNPEVFGIHVTFALFNSLQGFFILVFGTLLDVKVRSALKAYTSTGTTGTQSTSAGPSTSGGLGFLRNLGRRRGYNINSAAPVSTSGEAASYSS